MQPQDQSNWKEISQMPIDDKEGLRPVHTKNIKYNQKCAIYLTEFSSNTLEVTRESEGLD